METVPPQGTHDWQLSTLLCCKPSRVQVGLCRIHEPTDAQKRIDDETWVAGSSAQVQSLDLTDLEPGTYFRRVSTLDADGYESAWSHTAHFIYPMALR